MAIKYPTLPPSDRAWYHNLGDAGMGSENVASRREDSTDNDWQDNN
jgi:hypothetical protein